MPASGVDGANYYDCPVYKTTGRAAAKLQTGSDPHSGANVATCGCQYWPAGRGALDQAERHSHCSLDD